MAHGTHNGENAERTKSQVAFFSSFWLIVILVGVFVAALNFINVMGKGEEGHGGHEGHEGKAKTEETMGAKHEGHESHEGAAKEEAKPAAEGGEHKEAAKEEAKPATTPAPEHK